MAEGMLGGILGGEDEKPEVEAPEALAGAEAFAAAVAAKLAGNDPGVARKTETFLDKQSQLLKLQASTSKTNTRCALRTCAISSVRKRSADSACVFASDSRFFIALVATVIGIGAAIMIRDAVTSRRVVIEPFDAPPALAARGLTGKVVASGLLDELSRLQDATRSSAAARGLSGAWTSNIKLDVPETGVSIGEISRLLRERFGHDVHIDGDLIETAAGGLALTVRGNGVPPKTFSGSATELEKLTVEAAEYVYSKSQPARWAAYLTQRGALRGGDCVLPDGGRERRPRGAPRAPQCLGQSRSQAPAAQPARRWRSTARP